MQILESIIGLKEMMNLFLIHLCPFAHPRRSNLFPTNFARDVWWPNMGYDAKFEPRISPGHAFCEAVVRGLFPNKGGGNMWK